MSRFPAELRRWRTVRRLSQLELAIRADTTQRHVSFIEQGRSRPGRNVVVRLAESLDLTLRQRNELLLSAGFAPAFPESPLEDAALRQGMSGHGLGSDERRERGLLSRGEHDVRHQALPPGLLSNVGETGARWPWPIVARSLPDPFTHITGTSRPA